MSVLINLDELTTQNLPHEIQPRQRSPIVDYLSLVLSARKVESAGTTETSVFDVLINEEDERFLTQTGNVKLIDYYIRARTSQLALVSSTELKIVAYPDFLNLIIKEKGIIEGLRYLVQNAPNLFNGKKINLKKIPLFSELGNTQVAINELSALIKSSNTLITDDIIEFQIEMGSDKVNLSLGVDYFNEILLSAVKTQGFDSSQVWACYMFLSQFKEGESSVPLGSDFLSIMVHQRPQEVLVLLEALLLGEIIPSNTNTLSDCLIRIAIEAERKGDQAVLDFLEKISSRLIEKYRVSEIKSKEENPELIFLAQVSEEMQNLRYLRSAIGTQRMVERKQELTEKYQDFYDSARFEFQKPEYDQIRNVYHQILTLEDHQLLVGAHNLIDITNTVKEQLRWNDRSPTTEKLRDLIFSIHDILNIIMNYPSRLQQATEALTNLQKNQILSKYQSLSRRITEFVDLTQEPKNGWYDYVNNVEKEIRHYKSLILGSPEHLADIKRLLKAIHPAVHIANNPSLIDYNHILVDAEDLQSYNLNFKAGKSLENASSVFEFYPFDKMVSGELLSFYNPYVVTPLDAYSVVLQEGHPQSEQVRAHAVGYLKLMQERQDAYSYPSQGVCYWHAIALSRILEFDPEFCIYLRPAKFQYLDFVVIDPILAQLVHVNPALYQSITKKHPELLIPPNDELKIRSNANSEKIANASDAVNRLNFSKPKLFEISKKTIEFAQDQKQQHPEQLSKYNVLRFFENQVIDLLSTELRLLSDWLGTASDQESQILCQFLKDDYFPFLFSGSWRTNDIHEYCGSDLSDNPTIFTSIAKDISVLFVAIPKEQKNEWIPKLTSIYNEYSISSYEPRNFVNWDMVVSGLDSQMATQLIHDLVTVYNLSPRSFRNNGIDSHLYPCIDRFLIEHPKEGSNLLTELESIDPNSSYLRRRQYFISIRDFEPSIEIDKFKEDVQAVMTDEFNIVDGIAILAAYLPPNMFGEKTNKLKALISRLVKRNASEDFMNTKKVNDLYKFLRDNQESLAKLILLFPQSEHSMNLILETVEQHGFSRLEERLSLLTAITFPDIQLINSQLSGLPPSEITQGLILSIVSLVSAFKDSSIQHHWKWRDLINNQEFTSAKDLRDQLGKLFLIEIAISLGISPEIVTSVNLERWSLRNLPRLVEAIQRFKNDEHFNTLFQVIVKSSFLEIFDSIIDPSSEVDLSAFSEKEREMIVQIRRHNLDTQQRFAERGINIDIFQRGEEHRLTGQVSAQDIIVDAFTEQASAIDHILLEIDQIPNLDSLVYDHANQIRVMLRALELGSDNNPGVQQLVEYYEKSQNGSVPRHTDKKDVVIADRDLQVLQRFIFQHCVTTSHFEGKSIQKIRSDLPLDVHKMLKRSLKSEKTTSGDIQIVFKIINPIGLLAILSSNLGLLSEIVGEDNLHDLRVMLNNFDLTPTEETIQPTKPDIQPLMNELQVSINALMKSLLQQLDDTSQNSVSKDEIQLQVDHLDGSLHGIEDLRKTLRYARDQAYDVTIRRWRRYPPADLFFGNDLQCCVAIENFNGFGMMQFLVGKDFALDEIIDNTTGYRVGGTFDFIQERIDSSPEKPVLAYMIDNVELNPSHQFLRMLIRSTKLKMARELMENMIDDSRVINNGVRLGTSYNDVPTHDFPTVTETIRKIGGANMGLATYVDTAVKAHSIGSTLRNISAFLKTPTYIVSTGSIADVERRQSKECDVFVVDFGNHEEAGRFTAQYLNQMLDLERSLFGCWSSEQELIDLFSDGERVISDFPLFCYAVDERGKLLGFTLGSDDGDKEDQKTIYVRTSDVDWDYQNLGVGKKLRLSFEEEAKKRGYTRISRDAMADTGCAQRLLLSLLQQGKLIEPNVKSEQELEEKLRTGELFNLQAGNRSQIRIVSSI